MEVLFVIVVSVLVHGSDVGGGAGIAGCLLGRVLFRDHLLCISLSILLHSKKIFFGVE